jgi:hypothetical protein
MSIHTPEEESRIMGLLGSSEQVTLNKGFDPPSKISHMYWQRCPKRYIEVPSLKDLKPIGKKFFSE